MGKLKEKNMNILFKSLKSRIWIPTKISRISDTERKLLRSALVQKTASFVGFGVGEYSDQKEFTIFYVGNKEGQVYKVAQWTQDGKLKYV